MVRFIRPCLLTCLALFTSTVAWAQTGGTIGTGTGGTTGAAALSATDFTTYFESYDPGQKAWVQMNPTQQPYFFNRARCECDGDVINYSGYVKIVIQPASGTPQKIQALLMANSVSLGTGRLYAGSNVINCLDSGAYVGSLSALCTNLLDPSNYTASFPLTVFENQRVYESPPIPVAWLYNSLAFPACSVNGTCDARSACASTFTMQNIWFWGQTNSSTSPDNDNSSAVVELVGQVPYAPTDVTAVADNEALVVNWSWPAGLDPSSNPTFMGVQLFCQRGADAQVFATDTYAQSFMTPASLCPNMAPATSPNGVFGNLDPRYLCSGLIPPTLTSHRITGLQNGIPYGVGAAAVDRFGNLSEVSNITYAMPNSTTPISTPSYTSQGCSCELAGRHGRLGAFASLLGIGLSALCLRRRANSRSRRTAVFLG
jgi:hypothetical protein